MKWTVGISLTLIFLISCANGGAMLEIAPDKPVIPPGLESMVENANKRYLEEGGKGTVISKPEEVFALLYQNGFDEAIANYCSYKGDFAKYVSLCSRNTAGKPRRACRD